ncbi:MAG: flavodoxin family protein [Thermotaleaceae bacterium]
MKAVAILGSPRHKMNTDILLNEIIKGLVSVAVDVEKIQLGKLAIKPCIACGYCEKTGTCFIQDDITPLYDKFNQADIVVVASPLYFNSVSSITKIMVDRCQAFWSSKYVFQQSSIDRQKRRKGIFICTAGSQLSENGFIGATVVMDLFFRAINTEHKGSVLVDNTDKDFVGDNKILLDEVYRMGQELASL